MTRFVSSSRGRWSSHFGSFAFWLLASLIAPGSSVVAQELPSNRAAVQVWLELASDFGSADPASRDKILDSIDKQTELLDEQEALVAAALDADPDAHYRTLSPAPTTEALDYLRSLQVSYARFKGAQAAADAEWSAKQLKAAQEYAKLAATALTAEAQLNEDDAAHWRSSPLAMRRSPEQEAVFVEKLKSGGLSPEQRKLLLDEGANEASIDQFQKQLLQTPPDRIGLSAVEWLSHIAAIRRKLAKQLQNFSEGSPGAVAGISAQTFGVGNPHDREETIDLYIRPVSIPADWKLSIADAEGQAKFKVREVEPGKHYAITLPANEQVKVASTVVPVGEVGTNTTARWAVEGKIRDELIGGIVFEMNTPYVIADLTLPPVGSKEAEEELPAPSSATWARVAAGAAAGIVILGSLVYLFLFWRRRHRTGPPPAA